jgi:hypothetical protein
MTGAHRAKRTGLQPGPGTPPAVRCTMCDGLCRWDGDGWIQCRACHWPNQDRRRAGRVWRLRVGR